MMKKINVLFEGVAVPSIIFVGVTLTIAVVSSLAAELLRSIGIATFGELNAVFLQGIADILMLPMLIPLYYAFKKKHNIISNVVKVPEILHLIPVAFSICIICNILLQYLPFEEENEVSKEIFELVEKYNVFVVIFIVSILIPIVEEILFRGYFFDAITIVSNKTIAIIITSIGFAIIHGNLTQGIYALVAGLFFGLVKSKYNKVIYTVIMHLVMNFCSIIFVPAIIGLTDIRQKIYTLFICGALLFFSIYRIKKCN